MPVLFKVFQNLKTGTLPNSFSQVRYITTSKQNYRLIFLINVDAKNLDKVIACQIQQCIKGIICHDQVGFIRGMQERLNI